MNETSTLFDIDGEGLITREDCKHEIDISGPGSKFSFVDLAIVNGGINVHVRCSKCKALALQTIYEDELEWEIYEVKEDE